MYQNSFWEVVGIILIPNLKDPFVWLQHRTKNNSIAVKYKVSVPLSITPQRHREGMGVNFHTFWMKVSGWIHPLAILLSRKDLLVPFGYQGGWTEETVRKECCT
jgi:hypothetical protein